MAKIRIERGLIWQGGLWIIGADHLSLVLQQDDFDTGESQGIWRIIEGTRDTYDIGTETIGVDGVNEPISLSSENGGLMGDELTAVIGTPKSRGSTVLPSFTPAGDWAVMLTMGRQIDAQKFPYFLFSTSWSPLPTSNSSSVVATLLFSIGINIQNHMPTFFYTFTTGTETLLGTLADDTLFLSIDYGFDTILAGQGDDTLGGSGDINLVEKFYGGRGDDLFYWSRGNNLYHGGEPNLPYEADGWDELTYSGIGEVIIIAGESPVPHLSPKFIAVHHDFSIDQLFSIDHVSWLNESDFVQLGEGVHYNNERTELRFKEEALEGRGDVMDFSNQSSELLMAPSDLADVVLVGTSAPDGGFADGGLWARSLEWLTGSPGNDRMYAGPTMRGLEGGDGNDMLDGRAATVLSGNSPLGYDIELHGGAGDDTLVSGQGRSFAIGGAGADTFVLSALSENGRVTEFVIQGADSSDRLFLPFNFLVPDGGPYDGSELFPILAAISPVIGGATFEDLPQNPGPGSLGGFDAPGFFYLAGQVPLDGTWSGSYDGRINITDQVVFNRDGNDLLIHVWGTGEVYTEAFLSIRGQDFVFQEMDPDPVTETVIRVADFTEGMLGIRFYELGDETPFPFPGGSGTPDSSKLWNTAQFTLSGGTLLRDPLPGAPETPLFDRPSEGETEVRDEIAGNEQNNELIIIATAQIPGTFNTGADMSGGGGNDQLTGGRGRDTLDGGTGNDVMAGGPGDDQYFVESTGDLVSEAASSGFDTVFASIDYALPDHVEYLTLTGAAINGQGNAGNNLIFGNAGANILFGFGGSDRLVGGQGNDVLDGGTGNDFYVYQPGDGNDVIVSGGVAAGVDTLLIFGFAPEDVRAYQSVSGADVILRFADGARVVLQDFFAGGSISSAKFDNGFVWTAAAIATAAQAAGPLLNDAPVLADDLGIVAGTTSATIPKGLLLANDRDLDGDPLTIVAVESLTAGMSAILSAAGDVEVAAGEGLWGVLEFNYTVSDGRGGTTTARANIMLPDNAAPVINGTPIGEIEIEPGLAWTFDLPGDLFSDPDGEAVFVRARLADGSGLPSWLTFDGASHRFSGLVPPDFSGELIIRLIASDGLAETVTTFTLKAEAPVEGLVLIGTSLADLLVGGAGPDEFYGLGGHDTLTGGDGDDVFWATGSSGFDKYDGGAGFDTIWGSGGDDTIGVRATTRMGLDGNSVSIVLAGIEAIEGGDGFDVLQFENTADYIDLSAVTISGIELIAAGGGPDTVIGTAGNDVIDGGGHHDFLFGGAGDDIFQFSGSAGFDFYDGGEGFDMIVGSAGDDILALRHGGADLASIEAIDFGAGFDIVRMHTGNDVIDLSGMEIFGLEQIEGGAGADWIQGSAGSEILVGGTRQDTFYFAGFFGHDTIADFQLRQSLKLNGDLIDLSSFGFGSYLDVLSLTHDTNGHSVIQLTQTDSSITILNVAKSLLEADDFIL